MPGKTSRRQNRRNRNRRKRNLQPSAPRATEEAWYIILQDETRRGKLYEFADQQKASSFITIIINEWAGWWAGANPMHYPPVEVYILRGPPNQQREDRRLVSTNTFTCCALVAKCSDENNAVPNVEEPVVWHPYDNE
jgi:hypothetical protein